MVTLFSRTIKVISDPSCRPERIDTIMAMEQNKFVFFLVFFRNTMTFYLVVKLLSLDSDNTSKYDVIFFFFIIKRMFMPFTCNHMIVFMSHHFKNVVLIVPKVEMQSYSISMFAGQ